MKIDQDMMRAFREGERAAEEGRDDHGRANPYLYTSDMSDAWEIGRALVRSRRILDVEKIVGLSRRGLTVVEHSGRRSRWCVRYIRCTGAHEIWRAAA